MKHKLTAVLDLHTQISIGTALFSQFRACLVHVLNMHETGK